MTTTQHLTLRGGEIRHAVQLHQPFGGNGTLRGTRHLDGYGRLPSEYQTDLARTYDADDFYAVVSYGTPIAWFADGRWTVPAVRYSVTTSRHMSACGIDRSHTVTVNGNEFYEMGFGHA